MEDDQVGDGVELGRAGSQHQRHALVCFEEMRLLELTLINEDDHDTELKERRADVKKWVDGYKDENGNLPMRSVVDAP